MSVYGELEQFELQSAMKVWGALAEGDKLRLRDLIAGPRTLDMVEVDDPHGSNFSGATGRRYRIDYVNTNYETLFNLHLVTGCQMPGNYGCNGGPPANTLTPFGRIVARYGDAASIVEKATGRAV